MTLGSQFAIRLRAHFKWVLSFRKNNWELADYPVYVREMTPDPGFPLNNPRFQFHPYVATIANWDLSGFGDSKQDALTALEQRFADRRASLAEEGKSLPRPGTDVPLRFASQERVNTQSEIADDFVRRVMEFDSAWISDESSLWDFHAEETNQHLQEKIKQVYGVSVDDIESAKLCDIFDRIARDRSRTELPHN